MRVEITRIDCRVHACGLAGTRGVAGLHSPWAFTTFDSPKYLFDERDELGGCGGMAVRLRASEAPTRDNRRYTRIEIERCRKAGRRRRSPARAHAAAGGRHPKRHLASVALKAATSTRGIAGEPQEIIDTAVMYLYRRTAAAGARSGGSLAFNVRPLRNAAARTVRRF